MRVEPHTTKSYVHVLKRSSRGMNLFNSKNDYWRCLRLFYYMNDVSSHDWWEKDTENLPLFTWPEHWKERKPIVKILCYVLMPNHFHLMLQEVEEGGISLFMKKIGQSMTLHFNEKNKERGRGSIFQGGYKGRTIEEDIYIRYLASYIMVKNTFELNPKGGLGSARKNFNDAWEWALTYTFGSLRNYCSDEESNLIDKDILGEIFSKTNFKSFSKDVILGGKWEKKNGDAGFAHLAIE